MMESLPQLDDDAQARINGLLVGSEKLREGVFWQRRLFWAESHAQTRGEPQVIRTAKALAHVLDNMTVEIGEGELIVGRHPKGETPAQAEERMAKAHDMWGGHGLHEWAAGQLPDDAPAMMAGGLFNSGSKTGHMTPDYAGLLHRGLAGAVEQIDRRLRRLNGADPDYGEKRCFLKAAHIACEGAARFAIRYAERAEELAQQQEEPRRKGELLRIAAACRHVSGGPARDFHEAVQLSWFLHLWVCIENGEAAGAFAPGRVDQYLWPFFKADLEAQRLTAGQALELLLCWWMKLNEICYQAVQSVILGGTTPQGRSAANELTQLCLEATRLLGTLEPALVLRVHRDTPRCILQQAARLLRTGIGFPQLYNDEVACACLERAGVRREHARDYCIGGCVELTVQGMSDPWVGNFFNLPKCLLLALNKGVCALSGEQLGADTPPAEHMARFEDVLAAFRTQVAFCLQRMVACENVFDRAQAHCTPYPLLSANILDCIENARDITAGGARYNFTELQGVGLANTADSLAAIRKLVFEQRCIDLPELVAALMDDFADAEDLRVRLQSDSPKYGNADPEVDDLARFVVDGFVAEVEKYSNPRGGRFRAGLLVWDQGDAMGQMTGATPDGRRAGTVLADSIGPAQGRDRHGPTCVIHSSTAFDHSRIVGGLVLNMKFLPSTLEGEEGLEKFIDLVRSYFSLGGMQMQVNVVDDRTLRQAQERPEQYQNLTVRVSGWSARFLRLSERLQDEIIQRTAQSL